MDTKWNGTEVPAEYHAAPVKRGRAVRAAAGFLAFLMGVSLILGSAGAAAGWWAWQRGPQDWRQAEDWQDTASFRREISSYLRQFLSLGSGRQIVWYDSVYGTYYASSAGTISIVTEDGICQGAVAEPRLLEPWEMWEIEKEESGYDAGAYRQKVDVADLDRGFREDKNVLYYIKNSKDAQRTYSNGKKESFFESAQAQGYNFYLVFRDGKVSIRKDGQPQDVYGAGVYNEDSLWFLPGYENFPAGEALQDITVCMAVREDPLRYFSTDADGYGYMESGSLYYVKQEFEAAQAFYRLQAFLFGSGVLLLALWFLLRGDARLAAAKIASWTARVWTEARVLLLAGLICMFPLSGICGYWSLQEWYYSGEATYFFEQVPSIFSLRSLAGALENTPLVLALFWTLWLIYNDHRYNPKTERRSLWRLFRASGLKRPVEKRLNRGAVLLAVAVFLTVGEVLYALVWGTLITSTPPWLLWTLPVLPLLAAVWGAVCLLSRNRRLARDFGLLADQVESVRAGNLAKPLELPQDTDLQDMAEALNDIQAGMKAALEEQTRSERMKVELVSNVSHDLKTPLTSILSYAELLRQEDLPPAAADYAKIIDEKAQRLKSMVQDVFEVSKAAADQLPVTLEQLDLAKLLRQTLADMDGPIQRSPLTFRVDLPEEPVMIVADGKRLYRVFQNLIQNALQYALEGSRVYLTLKTAVPAAGQAEVSLRNTSRSELPEGVDFTARFVRGDGSRTDGGSGLGLSIAKSFTEASGGAFRVETMADLFTAVVTFPLWKG